MRTYLLSHDPRTRQSVVDDGDLVVQDVRVRLVEEKAFLEDRLIIAVQRHTYDVVETGPLKPRVSTSSTS